jgi:ATP-binding cassette subfamily F protein uup
MKRDIEKIEPAKVIILQMEINTSSEKGWTVLTDLTDKLQKVDNQIDAKEMEWLELSEVLEGLEVEEESNLSQYNKQII